VIAATLLVAGTIIPYVGTQDPMMPLALFGAALFIATVGFADDVKSIPVLPRLTLQAGRRRDRLLQRPPNYDRSGLPAGPNAACFTCRALVCELVNFMDGLD
jgi:hypothetical protein